MSDLRRRRELERLSKPDLITKVIEVEREMHARELHHFEEEQARAKAEAERDEALSAIASIRAARSNHPECDVHDDADPVTCGWKRTVQDIDTALSRIPEHPKED